MLYGAVVLREGVQTLHFRHPPAIGEKAERPRHHQGIIQTPIFQVGLSDRGDRRALLSLKQAFHRAKVAG